MGALSSRSLHLSLETALLINTLTMFISFKTTPISSPFKMLVFVQLYLIILVECLKEMIVNVKMGYNNPKIQTLLKNVLFVFQDRLPQLLSQAYDATSTRCCREVGLSSLGFYGFFIPILSLNKKLWNDVLRWWSW